MTNRQPKRNDPCPCGSGKLYKHCCKPGRRKRFRRQRETALAPPTPARSASKTKRRDPLLPDDFGTMLEKLERQIPTGRRQEFDSLFKVAKEIADYEEKEDEIEAAMVTLEEHWQEFEDLSRDPAQAMERAQRLFAEERFRPLGYTADQVEQAFEAVGYPSNLARPSAEDVEIIRSAILHLAEPEDRLRLTRKLLILLPEYVAQARYLDAWLIQYSAMQMLEAPEESNPFLVEMFHHGFVELGKQLQSQQQALLERLDIDPTQIADMEPAEVQALLEKEFSSPEATTQAEAFFTAHPLFGKQLQAQFREWEREAIYLLQREDAQHLRLAPEETAPWLSPLLERLAAFEEEIQQAREQDIPVDPQVLQAIQKVFFAVTSEMAPAVFEPGRIEQLVSRLKEYQYQLLADGEKAAARSAFAAYTALELEEDLAQNPFLIAICHVSLIEALASEEEEADP